MIVPGWIASGFILALSCVLSLHLQARPDLQAPLTESEAGKTSDLVVDIHGVTSNTGSIEISLLSSERQWRQKEAEFCIVRTPARKGKVRWIFKNIPRGEYALFVFHDINGNRDFDRNWRGIPIEPYALSGASWQSLTAATFVSAKFRVHEAEQAVVVGLVSQKKSSLINLLSFLLHVETGPPGQGIGLGVNSLPAGLE